MARMDFTQRSLSCQPFDPLIFSYKDQIPFLFIPHLTDHTFTHLDAARAERLDITPKRRR